MSEAGRATGFLAGAHPIEGYGAGGFRFAGISHRGSLIAVPDGVHAWSAREPSEISAEALAPVFASAPGSIDLLLLGTGTDLVPVSRLLREKLKAAGIVVDPMATGAAARTYNILLGERRRVAAALLAVA